MTFRLSPSERAALEGFHTNSLADGVLAFEFPHPETEQVLTGRWINDFEISEPDRDLYTVAIDFEFTL